MALFGFLNDIGNVWMLPKKYEEFLYNWARAMKCALSINEILQSVEKISQY